MIFDLLAAFGRFLFSLIILVLIIAISFAVTAFGAFILIWLITIYMEIFGVAIPVT